MNIHLKGIHASGQVKCVQSCLGVPLLDLQSCNIEEGLKKHVYCFKRRTIFFSENWVWSTKIFMTEIPVTALPQYGTR